MSKRPTISDLAETAGVSVATVDRVLNGRAKVREETARRVYDAARRIGYHATTLIGQRLLEDLPEIRFGFVFHKEKHDFYQTLRASFEAAIENAGKFRGRARFAYATSHNPREFAQLMEDMAERTDVIAATAVNHIDISDTVERLQAAGTPCFSLMNDFAQGIRQNYIGLNNMKAGRIAAHLISATQHTPGKVAIFVGGNRWHGHDLRETGFRSYFREYAPEMTVLDTLVNLETRELTYEATLDLLERHPDLRALYCAGGGMEGAIAALREAREPGDVKLVIHELTTESRKALLDRYAVLAIATPIRHLCEEAVSIMSTAIDQQTAPPPGQIFLRPDLYLPESI